MDVNSERIGRKIPSFERKVLNSYGKSEKHCLIRRGLNSINAIKRVLIIHNFRIDNLIVRMYTAIVESNDEFTCVFYVSINVNMSAAGLTAVRGSMPYL